MRNKSDENWQVGQRCLNNGDINAATSRLYYGVFQAVLTWARIRKGYNKTTDVHGDMCRFVKTEGKHSNHCGKVFAEMRGFRESADYQPDTPPIDEIKELLDTCDKIRAYYLQQAGV